MGRFGPRAMARASSDGTCAIPSRAKTELSATRLGTSMRRRLCGWDDLDQDHVLEVLIFQNGDDVLDMRVEADLRAQQMRSFTEPGQRRRENLVPSGLQHSANALPAPTSVPRTVYENE